MSLSSSVLDFGCVEEGGVVVQTVELVNSAPVEAFYQWDLDCTGNSVFSIMPASGTVCPHSHTTVEAVYKPTQPIAHHRRVTCIILHRVGANMQTHTHSQGTHTHTHITNIHCIYIFALSCRSPYSLTLLVPVTQSSSNQ